MIINTITIDRPVTSVMGVITVDLPEYQTRLILTNVKQVKGLGTKDAVKLRGTTLKSDHIYTLKIILKADEPLTAEQIRVRAKGLRFFETQQNFEVNKRPLSELLALQYVEIIPHTWPPKYQLTNKEHAAKLLEAGVFG